MDFNAEFKSKIDTINAYLDKYLDDKKDMPQTIIDSMRYSIFAGGKRIRPVLMMAAYELFRKEISDVMPFACALEMIHTYSLIHDDLPAMDNSDLRRGRKTNHIVYGEAIAILAGDALLNYAFETILSNSHIKPKLSLEATAYMAKCAGIHGMIGGQVIDIQSENKIITKDELQNLHDKKTGGLIRAGAVCGAILGGASYKKTKLLEEYAINLGIAFQIKDDILDVEGDTATLGKPVGGDDKLNKNTYVSLYGLDETKKLLVKHTELAKKSLIPFGKKSSFLNCFTDYLLERSN